MPADKLSEAVSSNVADIDMWAAHTHQLVSLLMQIQRSGEEKQRVWLQERTAADRTAMKSAANSAIPRRVLPIWRRCVCVQRFHLRDYTYFARGRTNLCVLAVVGCD